MIRKSIARNIIEQASSKNCMGTLVYFLWLKIKFKKPIFYNYNVRIISKYLNTSPTTASKHIKVMVEMGWATIRNGHLCLISNNKLKDKYSPIIPVQLSDNKKQQLIFLRYVLLKKNTDSQIEQINSKNAIVTKAKYCREVLSKKQINTIRKAGGIKKLERTYQNRITLSNRKIGKILNRSQSTGIRYQKQFRESGLITSIAAFKNVNFDLFTQDLGRIMINNRDGLYYSQLSNTIIPSQSFK